MKMVLETLKVLDKFLLSILKTITIIAFISITLLVTATIVGRYIRVSFLWSDEIIEILFSYLVFYGAAALWISGGHFSAGNWIDSRILKNRTGKHIYRLILEIMVLAFVTIFFYYSLQLTLFVASVTNVLAIPKKIFYSCMPISGAIMIIYTIRDIAIQCVTIKNPSSNSTLNM